MENASKALIMAAGVLIGILILSLAVYLFVSFGTTSAEIHKQNEEKQINQFNSQFISYEGKEDITIYDVVTIANLATENNIYYEFDKRNQVTEGKDNYISVVFINSDIEEYNRDCIEKGIDTQEQEIRQYYIKLISLDLQHMDMSEHTEESALTHYDCKVQISDVTKRVCRVTFTKKE